MDCSGFIPVERSASTAKLIIMIAFFLTIPISSTIPIKVIKLSSYLKSHIAISAPRPADGNVDSIVMGCR